ncbi:MAG: dihydroorotase [Thermodesulfovibrionales bacterium]|nr:dihydroorotase [Thermodesulfovibrionales bacterium]
MRILIAAGHVIDPSQAIDGVFDILIKGRKIEGIYPKGKAPKGEIDRVIDARGMYVLPGLVDMHTHLREPGFEHKETIKTGTLAAIKAGFTSVCAMPNTMPVNDSAGITEYILQKAEEEGACAVFPIGAITKGQAGEELTDMDTMRNAGCVAFSDDGFPVEKSLLMRRALEYSKACGVPLIAHSEDLSLSAGGMMNEGLLSQTLGLGGIPNTAEETAVFRDIALSELTGARLHIAHVSTEGSVRIIRAAKSRGVKVTAETCPHYFSITEEAVKGYNTNAKVNPPLRTERDVKAIKEGLRDGAIDVIATDHAPHSKGDKMKEFDLAPSGISGLETALGLSLRLVDEGVLTLTELIRKMTVNPATILSLNKGGLKPGSDADAAIIDLKKSFNVDINQFESKGKNTPFDWWLLKGAVVVTVAGGKVHRW